MSKQKVRKCKSGKKQYYSSVSAHDAARRTDAWYGKNARVYACPLCKCFHLSTN